MRTNDEKWIATQIYVSQQYDGIQWFAFGLIAMLVVMAVVW